MAVLATSTGQKVGNAKITTAPTASTASAITTRLRLRRVASIAAPIGVCTAEAQQAADGRDPADGGLAPVLLRHQEHVEVRPERAAHVGQQEVQRVKRDRIEMRAAARLGGLGVH